MIFAWLERRREASRKRRWQRGYDYASGSLLRGEKHKLEVEVDNPFDPNEFEDGMRAALLDWRFRHRAENERLRAAATSAGAALAAAIELLERGREDAPSKRMFSQMLADYRVIVARTRKALEDNL